MNDRYYIKNEIVSREVYSKYKDIFYNHLMPHNFPFNGLKFILNDNIINYPQWLLDMFIKDNILGDITLRDEIINEIL